MSRINPKGNDIGDCTPESLSKAGDNCPCTPYAYAQQAILMPPKPLCNRFPFDITKAELVRRIKVTQQVMNGYLILGGGLALNPSTS